MKPFDATFWQCVRARSLTAKPAMWLLLALASLSALATPPPVGVAPLVYPAGGFAIDGDVLANSPVVGIGDWVAAPGGGGGVLDAAGVPLDPATTLHFSDPFNSTSDNTFVGGLKWGDNPNTWQWTTGKASSKTDINNVLLHVTTDTNGHVWTVVAADRSSTSGDSYIDFEFLQNPLVRHNDGTFTSAGPNGGRSTNDLLLSLTFTSGGSVADFFAWRWVSLGGGSFGYQDATASLPAGKVFVAANSSSIPVPYGAFGLTNYAPNAFAEAAIDLTALIGNFDPCVSFGFKTIMVKTKASQSSSATIVDFIDPIQYTLQVGPSANAGPDQTRCTEGDSTSFPLRGIATAGVQPVASTTWSVVSGTATIDSPSDLNTTAHLASGTATLRLTVVESNGCTETDDVILRVAPLPACSISGPSTACPRGSVQFVGAPGMSSYSWSIAGNGSISGPANAQTVTVRAGDACGTNFVLTLNVESNLCSSACSTDVLVIDTAPPTLVCPVDLVLECPADTRTNATGVASAQDDCSVASLSYNDSITNTCGGAKIIARTWTASDLCGNTASATQIITVRDTRPPTITAPASVTLECPANTATNATGMATAQDGCSSVAISFSDSISNSCGAAQVITRTWTATDACGNTAAAVQVITVRDRTPPTITAPADLVLECPANTTTNATGAATAQDTCGAVTISYSDSVSNSCGGTRVIARRWMATDDCGNSVSAVQTITVRDTLSPSLTVPPDLVLECPADTTTNATGVATALDGCGTVTVSFHDGVSNTCNGTKVIARTWTATDQCGNSASAVQTITVQDTSAPTLVRPPDLVLDCPADTRTNATGVATAHDGCGAVTVTYSDSVSNGCGGTRVIARTWLATDGCGNATSALQTITVRDITRPTITAPADLVLECPAVTTTNATGVAVAQDGCSAVTVTYSDSVSNTCGGAKVIARTWTATDQCGNSASALQMITVRDTIAPMITAPPSLVLECPANTATNATGVATAVEGCSSAAITYSDIVSNSCGGTKVIYRTWTAADQCGNHASALQTITVRDSSPPSLRLPPNLTLECPGDTRTNTTGVAVAQDGCGAVSLSYSDVVSNSCGLTRTVLRLWTATDACGNTTNGLQTILVQDTTPPRITCPNLSVQCPGDVPAPYANLAAFLAAGGTASDSCSPTLTFSQTSDSGLVGSCPGTVTRVYRVTDACGNNAEASQTITVRDTIPPVLTCPTNRIVECGTSLDPLNTGRATATDNCSTNVSLGYTDAIIPSQYDIKFYAADPGSNSGPYAPTYIKVAPGSLACPASAPLTGRAADPLRNAVAYGPTAGQLDALTSMGGAPMCFGQIVPFEIVIDVSGGPGPERGTIDFTASWGTHTTSNDSFGYDTNYMVYCAFVDYADPGTVDPHTNARVQSYTSTVINPGTIAEQILGNFRVSGLNSGDHVIVEVWLVLMSAPAANFGGTIASSLVSAQKATDPPEPITIGTQTVAIGNLSKIGPLPPPQTQPPLGPLPPQPPVPPGFTVSVIGRTWTATDDCGNRSTCTQQITVRDTAAPALNVPADLVLECPADTSTNHTGSASVVEACGSATISYSDTVTNGCGGNRIISRLWIATDISGNSTNAVQTITVRDTTPPTITAPASRVLECPADTSTNVTGVATATDGCGSVTLSYSDLVTNICGVARVIARTWTATDACGNSATAQQTITVLDTTPPSITAPSDVTLEAPADTGTNATGIATALDGCSGVSLSYSDVVSNACGNARTILRTWTATDGCGNSASAVQTIVVRDTIPPTITIGLVQTADRESYSAGASPGVSLPGHFSSVFPNGIVIGILNTENLTAPPNGLWWPAETNGWDRLQAALLQADGPSGPILQDTINPSDMVGSGDLGCQAVLLTLNIGWNTAGILGVGPNNFGSLAYRAAGDSLNGQTINQILAAANRALAGLGLPAGYDFAALTGLLRELNGSFHDFTPSPWALSHLSQPALVVQCAAQVPLLDAVPVRASDSSGSPVVLTNLPDVISDQTCLNHYTITRTWIATDACGNTNGCAYQILVNDITPPTLGVSPDRTISAGEPLVFDEPVAVDNCTGDVVVHVISMITNKLANNAISVACTWLATDACGNSVTGQQIITILNALAVPPSITSQPSGQTAGYGDSTILRVSASGTGPFAYQWRFNGTNIAGATGSSLDLSRMLFGNAGLYSVVVGNAAGAVTSSVAVVNVAPKLYSQFAGNALILTWAGPFMLQSAPSPAGPYKDVPYAMSPSYQSTLDSVQKYFRLRSRPFALSLDALPGGEYRVNGAGIPGCNFVLQASSDLVHWTRLATNAGPFQFIDADARQYSRRFYRSVLLVP